MCQEKKGLPRWIDATLSLLGLIVAAPLIVLAAFLILLTSGRPILFRQARVGQHGRLFNLYKMRTMRPSLEGAQVTASHDQRITGIGRFLRRTKLDELPTLWNVIRGDMALVGPRPEVPRFVNLDNALWRRVLQVRPGITDPVTLRLRSEEELLGVIEGDPQEYYVTTLQPLKLEGYASYLEHRTWLSDLGVLASTLTAVLWPGKVTGLSDNPDHDSRGAHDNKGRGTRI